MLLGFTFVFLCLFGFPLSAFAQDGSGESVDFLKWLADNWELATLILSELLAFLPAKYTGIVKGLFTIIGKVILWIAQKSNK